MPSPAAARPMSKPRARRMSVVEERYPAIIRSMASDIVSKLRVVAPLSLPAAPPIPDIMNDPNRAPETAPPILSPRSASGTCWNPATAPTAPPRPVVTMAALAWAPSSPIRCGLILTPVPSFMNTSTTSASVVAYLKALPTAAGTPALPPNSTVGPSIACTLRKLSASFSDDTRSRIGPPPVRILLSRLGVICGL